MKKCLLIPAIIFPYTVCLCLAYGFIFQSFANTTIKILGIIAVATFALSFICNLIFIFTTRNTSFKELLKSALLIKAIHIPTYIAIFLLGVIMGMMFFMTFPFILFLMFIDLLTLWISSMISLYSIIKALKDKSTYSTALLVITLFCQFFWCADIISLFIIFIMSKIKKAKKTIKPIV